ncbi:MAG: hypothetical protein APU95_06120 [Hadesarchaea archaeon YNP_N21]|nr:MAG: hypothetical protein APU95_06120 [Hadesarchaea archaeon YNP_N21]
MAKVSARVMLFATLRRKYGAKDLIVECNGTLPDLIENVSKILGESFIDEVYDKNRDRVKENIILMINGRNVRDMEKIEIRDGDTIAIFPPIAGGQPQRK